ncbi:MAG: hypothetical protein CML21_00610 [Rheinheimera sp.]|nr:hypothetical protein [Rheinheimera sp.]|tara:strand:- start:5237 stop:5845 length:609 start_codon:yes stop_codon:yes gene_type:complete
MAKFRAVPDDEKMWPAFYEQQKGFIGLSISYIKDPLMPVPEFTITDYLTDIQLLADYLTPLGFQKISGRYRVFKTRSKTEFKTITLKQSTLWRLEEYARLNGFSYDSYDQLFEFMIDPEERLEHARGVESIPSSLSLEESFQITRAKLSLRTHTWAVILNFIEYAYRAGWLACKHLSGAKRTDKVLDEHAEKFILDTQVNDK